MHIENRSGNRADRRIFIAERLDFIENVRRPRGAARLEATLYYFTELFLAYRHGAAEEVVGNFVFEVIFLSITLNEAQILRHIRVEYNSSDRGLYSALHRFAVYFDGAPYVDFVLHMNELGLISHQSLVLGYIGVGDILFGTLFALGAFVISVAAPAVELALFAADNRKIVRAENHILRGLHNGLTVGKFEYVVRGKHQKPCFRLRLNGEGHVNGHLVAVEVRVERRTYERVNFYRSALDEHGFESLN